MNKQYPNKFVELGYKAEAVERRLKEIVDTLFFGSEEKRIYGEIDDMAYVTDTGNKDVRTEGMSYAMMVFVQLDMKIEFDKIWKFSKTYMHMSEGENAGYFAWSVGLDGKKNALGPAPDGEEYYAMALFFAAHRWGNGEGILNYEKEAKELLAICVHKGEHNEGGFPMWEPTHKLIKFVPNLDFSDPSYHLPHFYRLFALWAEENDRQFWEDAATASRAYLKKACHPQTGLSSEYADYEGNPYNWNGHDVFYSDSYRVAANIGLYHAWYGDDMELCDCVNRLQRFFKETVPNEWDYVYKIDGTKIDEKILHPVGLVAANAMGSLATEGKASRQCIEEFYATPLREGERRYYDNFLYVFAWMALSGNFRIW
jgi:oligosaccharide reducing-end xylanase